MSLFSRKSQTPEVTSPSESVPSVAERVSPSLTMVATELFARQQQETDFYAEAGRLEREQHTAKLKARYNRIPYEAELDAMIARLTSAAANGRELPPIRQIPVGATLDTATETLAWHILERTPDSPTQSDYYFDPATSQILECARRDSAGPSLYDAYKKPSFEEWQWQHSLGHHYANKLTELEQLSRHLTSFARYNDKGKLLTPEQYRALPYAYDYMAWCHRNGFDYYDSISIRD